MKRSREELFVAERRTRPRIFVANIAMSPNQGTNTHSTTTTTATYLTMKTPGAHSRSNSQSYFTHKPTGTPLASPRIYSVGQPYPPRLSPDTSAHQQPAQQQDARIPSPNYFGLSVDHAVDPLESAVLPSENWSSPSSSVKSFAAAMPKPLPLDANPDFEAFRRQIDANLGRSSFSLSGSHFNITMGPRTPGPTTPFGFKRPEPPKRHNLSLGAEPTSGHFPRLSGLGLHGPLPNLKLNKDIQNLKQPGDNDSIHDSAYISGDSKRSSQASLNAPSFFNMGRHESPAQIDPPFGTPVEWGKSAHSISRVDDRHPRLSMSSTKAEPPMQQRRADTVPPNPKAAVNNDGPAMIDPARLKDLMDQGDDSDLLLLDIRVSPQYAVSRVKGALNLCIPTTLLKRATFNLQKLQQTFSANQDQDRFSNWRNAKYLVVYDASSSDKRDAMGAINMIKKFTNEGFSGSANILRGGFRAFAETYPNLIDRGSSATTTPALSLGQGAGAGLGGANIPPVIGGVMLPTTGKGPNPFFNNIRQNQDLVDGVGQMDIGLPQELNKETLPKWLKEAADSGDHGKKVSEKFLSIELTEQSRMKDAYSVFTPGANGGPKHHGKVQLSGIEKGGKNRYKDILPFEHARVRLQGRQEGECDYVNASHIQASRSKKRYIASQGPLPATFEDFWSVIWDQDVRVIVMLTAESEGGQLKCHPYWKGKDFGPIKLRVLSEKKVSLDIDKHRQGSQGGVPTTLESASATTNAPSGDATQGAFPWNPTQAGGADGGRRRANTTTVQPNLDGTQQPATALAETPYVIIRKFALSHSAYPFLPMREITQLHYPSWPDFGAPAQPSHLLALVELANIMQRAAPALESSGAAPSDEIQVDVKNFTNRLKRGDSLPLDPGDAPEPNDHARPMLVHCSAGCGRTGAFCTVDSVIDMLKRQRMRKTQKADRRIDDRFGGRRISETDGEVDGVMDGVKPFKRQATENNRDQDGDISMGGQKGLRFDHGPGGSGGMKNLDESKGFDFGVPPAPTEPKDDQGIDTTWLDDDGLDLIAKTVEDFRGQRLSMVQSLRQFVLCYETVIEWIWRLEERSHHTSAGGAGGRRGSSRVRTGSLAL
ncbi:hypothetical protein GE21DRAFT_2959 [Neurospora crassa]|uniref:protein-tyrosine-phosphatase n=2 Tax=Neurospora crassa TaxID=5141 RepID=Q1K8L1_NEUCR|nr:tyrosine-protein phosphatase non-receptor type 6 [Neurospora crassa OR74A]EAA34119.3 tyrosine-protein phosphatase non-receptor type 6 [Neurospora crassa OR74A]KHE80062.1 hypothetical protein GE21DRAFT_2959 [Neurospora crassa]CAB91306.2 related to protein-tyrosine-phosphatase [Neurospora crassa]|eukprot:XP_963355.3 tyrosine-protein phosphatase non-receptor type 6 [Neurospora crassa OR74A]